jgi:hypothetical protein
MGLIAIEMPVQSGGLRRRGVSNAAIPCALHGFATECRRLLREIAACVRRRIAKAATQEGVATAMGRYLSLYGR